MMTEQQVYDEELAQHNALGQYFVRTGAVVPSTVPPPPLNKDGSLVRNANPNHDEVGRFASGEMDRKELGQQVAKHFGHLFAGGQVDKKAFLWKVEHEDKLVHIQPVKADDAHGTHSRVMRTREAAESFEKENPGWNVIVRDPEATHNIYMTAEEAVTNFNPNHDDHGRFAEHGAEHALEHTGHELHTAHEVEEVYHALGHAHAGDVIGIGARHVAGDAVKLAAKAIAAVPGGRRVAEKLTDLHDGAEKLGEHLVSQLQERYGKATAAAILGSGAIAAAAVRNAAGLGGPLGHAIPGQKFIGAIPIVALAEAGRAAGLVHPDSKLEKHVATAAKWVHAVREAIGRPVKAVKDELAKTGLKAAHAAGKLTRAMTNEEFDVDKLAEELVDAMYEGYADKAHDALEEVAKEKTQESVLPHVRSGMHHCSGCGKGYYTQAKAEGCCGKGEVRARSAQ